MEFDDHPIDTLLREIVTLPEQRAPGEPPDGVRPWTERCTVMPWLTWDPAAGLPAVSPSLPTSDDLARTSGLALFHEVNYGRGPSCGRPTRPSSATRASPRFVGTTSRSLRAT